MRLIATLLLSILVSPCMGQMTKSDTLYLSQYADTCGIEDAHTIKIFTYEYSTLKIWEYSKNWTIKSVAFYKIDNPDIKDGYCKWYSPKGLLESEGNYIEGKKSGLWKSYDEDGALQYQEDYLEGKLHGKLISYYKDQAVKREEYYSKGEFVRGKCFTQSGQDTSHFPFIVLPEFPGGEKGLYKFLGKETAYPSQALDEGAQGLVRVEFLVEKDGSITDIRVRRSIHPALSREAVRVIEKMPNWQAGKLDGEIRATKFIVPIKFVLK